MRTHSGYFTGAKVSHVCNLVQEDIYGFHRLFLDLPFPVFVEVEMGSFEEREAPDASTEKARGAEDDALHIRRKFATLAHTA